MYHLHLLLYPRFLHLGSARQPSVRPFQGWESKGRLLLLLCLPLLTLACEKEPLDLLDELVPATQEGANTLGCLIDGEVFYNRGGSWNVPDVAGSYGSSPSESIIVTGFERNDSSNALDYTFVRIELDNLTLGPQPLTLIFEGYGTRTNSIDRDVYLFDSTLPHEVSISHIDRGNFTVSGTFYFSVTHPGTGAKKEISEGRFDVKYQ